MKIAKRFLFVLLVSGCLRNDEISPKGEKLQIDGEIQLVTYWRPGKGGNEIVIKSLVNRSDMQAVVRDVLNNAGWEMLGQIKEEEGGVLANAMDVACMRVVWSTNKGYARIVQITPTGYANDGGGIGYRATLNPRCAVEIFEVVDELP